MDDQYTLLDSGEGKKLEKFGPHVICRPAQSAIWNRQTPSLWQNVSAELIRDPEARWIKKVKEPWTISVSGIRFKLELTDFGHLGIFPEQAPFWKWIQEKVSQEKRELNILNLFAYSGGSTLSAAFGGAKVCHVDASKAMMGWARENASINGLENAPIRWIVDDVMKFLAREKKRGQFYDGIILDPPSFGRGTKGEVFKIDDQIIPLLQACKDCLSQNPLFVLFSCHTLHFSPLVMKQLLQQVFDFPSSEIDSGEMFLDSQNFKLPSGTYARWQK